MKRTRALSLFILVAVAWLFGQSDPARAQEPVPEDTSAHVYIVSHGWHVGVAIPREQLEPGQWPEVEEFPDANYLEVGWGDAGYYPHPDPGLWRAIRAALWPTPSVLHVVGFREPVREFFPWSEIIRINVSPAGLDSLVAYIRSFYARDEQGETETVAPSLYGKGLFYRAEGSYHLFNNSNTWAARALRAAGKRVSVCRSLTSGGVLRQARAIGETIQERRKPTRTETSGSLPANSENAAGIRVVTSAYAYPQRHLHLPHKVLRRRYGR